ncbi:MAG: hypothetical protein ABIN58_06220 [candidate division WOR-3 bacterium]
MGSRKLYYVSLGFMKSSDLGPPARHDCFYVVADSLNEAWQKVDEFVGKDNPPRYLRLAELVASEEESLWTDPVLLICDEAQKQLP